MSHYKVKNLWLAPAPLHKQHAVVNSCPSLYSVSRFGMGNCNCAHADTKDDRVPNGSPAGPKKIGGDAKPNGAPINYLVRHSNLHSCVQHIYPYHVVLERAIHSRKGPGGRVVLMTYRPATGRSSIWEEELQQTLGYSWIASGIVSWQSNCFQGQSQLTYETAPSARLSARQSWAQAISTLSMCTRQY